MINSIPTYKLRRKSPPLDCDRPILTEQTHKELTDINNIMENYVKTGMLPNYSGSPLLYIDETNQPTFEQAHDSIAYARHRFDQLPTSLKNELQNDYRKLEAWLTNPDNQDRAIKMGLLHLEEKPKPSELQQLTEALNKNLLKNPPKEGGGAKD